VKKITDENWRRVSKILDFIRYQQIAAMENNVEIVRRKPKDKAKELPAA